VSLAEDLRGILRLAFGKRRRSEKWFSKPFEALAEFDADVERRSMIRWPLSRCFSETAQLPLSHGTV